MPTSGAWSSWTVIVRPRSADHEPCSSEHHLLSDRAQRSRSSKAATGVGNPLLNSRSAVSVAPALRKGSKPPAPLTAPSRCSIPSCRACHQVPRTALMPVPSGGVQRQRAKRVPETVPCPSRVRLLTWTPSKGSPPAGTQKESGRNFAPPVVSAQLASAPAYQPHWATAYFPASAFAATNSNRLRASSSPSARFLPTASLVPDIGPPSLDCVRRSKGWAAKTLPPPRPEPTPLRESMRCHSPPKTR